MHRLSIIGGGRMGDALLGGLVHAGWASADQLAVVEALAARRDELAAQRPGVHVESEPSPTEAAVIAVKPGDVDAAVRAAVAAGATRILSIAAGVPIARLETAATGGGPDGQVVVVRAMPNTPSLVGVGASAVAGGTRADDEDLAWAESILGAVGTVVRVSEPQLDAVTGLSGSGPAYVFLVVESLIEAGVLAGLPRPVSRDLAIQTVLGAATLLAEGGEGPEALRAAVTSPGGTTAAGLRALESHGVRSAFLDAVTAAAERARELGG